MHLTWILAGLALTCAHISLTTATMKRRKTEEEPVDTNSINYMHSDSPSSHRSTLLTSLMQDATVPVFLVMGLASIATALASSKSLQTNDVNGSRKKRSFGTGWTNNVLKVLGNVQRAVEKYQQLEEEITNELDEEMKKEFSSKSLE